MHDGPVHRACGNITTRPQPDRPHRIATRPRTVAIPPSMSVDNARLPFRTLRDSVWPHRDASAGYRVRALDVRRGRVMRITAGALARRTHRDASLRVRPPKRGRRELRPAV